MRLIDAHEYYKELKKEMGWPHRSKEFIDAIEVAIADLGDMPTILPESLINEELKFTREFIREHGLEFALAEAWRRRASE